MGGSLPVTTKERWRCHYGWSKPFVTRYTGQVPATVTTMVSLFPWTIFYYHILSDCITKVGYFIYISRRTINLQPFSVTILCTNVLLHDSLEYNLQGWVQYIFYIFICISIVTRSKVIKIRRRWYPLIHFNRIWIRYLLCKFSLWDDKRVN